MMYFEKDLVNKAIALIDEKSKSDELKAFTDVNDINNMIRNLQINRDYQCDAIKSKIERRVSKYRKAAEFRKKNG